MDSGIRYKILTVAGAQPPFIKIFDVSWELRSEYDEILVHTGQHYGDELSDVLFPPTERTVEYLYPRGARKACTMWVM